MEKEEIKKIVRENYAKFAINNSSCCSSSQSCCGQTPVGREISSNIGYSEEEMDKVPQGSNLGLGCGNPIALASLKEGEAVLDLGSGAVLKVDYINKIKNAGFSNIKVLDEVSYPIKYIISDGTAKIVKESLNISEDEFNELENLVLSIKVSAFKQ